MTIKSIELLKQIGTPLSESVSEVIESEELYQFAFKNNIELLYLEKLRKSNKLDKLKSKHDELITREKDTLKTIHRLSSVLNKHSIPHAFTKTLRPYPGTPNDIDCLYLGELSEYEKNGNILQSEHYRLTAPNAMQYEFFDELSDDEFSKLKSGGRFYIDFYRELAADHMPYMDSDALINKRIQVPLKNHNEMVTVFEPSYEMIILSLHSVIMHRIIPLEVIYTYSYYMSEMSEDEIRNIWTETKKNHAELAMRTVLTTMNLLYKNAFGETPQKLKLLTELSGIHKSEMKNFVKEDFHMPHIVNLSTFVFSVFGKLRGKRSRRGFIKELVHMLNPVFAVEVLYHMLSKKYAIKHSEHV